MVTIKDIEAIIKASGNSLHCEVAKLLKEQGWSILVSPYYTDGATNKPREIDLIAEKCWKHGGNYGIKSGAIIIKLFIECKYIPQPHVFWFGEKDVTAATEWLVNNTPLKEDNTYTQKHHYLADSAKAAKLFASSKDSNKNPENEAIYKALNQCLNAMVSLRGRGSLIPYIRDRELPVYTSIEMPVILCNSFADFYRVEMEDTPSPQKIDKNFLLEVNYAYLDAAGRRQSEYFLLDVVDFMKISNYLETIESDIKNAISYLLPH